MDDIKLDALIMEKINEESSHVPDVVRSRVEEVLSRLPRRRSRAGKLGLGLVAALVVFSIITVSSIFIPAFAEAVNKIPVVGSVFGFAGDIGLKLAREKGLTAPDVRPAEDQGIRVSISDILYDGTRISIGYVVEHEDGFKTADGNFGVEFFVNGRSLHCGWGGWRQLTADNRFIGLMNITPDKELSDKFGFTLVFNEINGVRGKWEIKNIKVVKQDESLNSKTYRPMASAKLNGGNIIVTKVILTDATTSIEIIGKELNLGMYRCTLEDDQGSVIQPHGGGSSGSGGIFRTTLQFDPVKVRPEYLTLQIWEEYNKEKEGKQPGKLLEMKIPLAGR